MDKEDVDGRQKGLRGQNQKAMEDHFRALCLKKWSIYAMLDFKIDMNFYQPLVFSTIL